MAFDLENKIRWEELSPSLQDKFVQIWGSDGESVMPIHNITEIWKQIKKILAQISALQSQVNSLESKVNALDNKVTKLDTKVDNLKDVVNKNSEITLGQYGNSVTATAEDPANRGPNPYNSCGHNLGERMLVDLGIGTGFAEVYRHSTVKCYGMDPDEANGVNGFKNVKRCTIRDMVIVEGAATSAPSTDFFISIPSVFPMFIYLDTDKNIICYDGTSNVNAFETDAVGAYVTEVGWCLYIDINPSTTSMNPSDYPRIINNPKYNGNGVRIFKIHTTPTYRFKLTVNTYAYANIDEYAPNKLYSAEDLMVHTLVPCMTWDKNQTTTSARKFINDIDWVKMVHITSNYNSMINYLRSV